MSRMYLEPKVRQRITEKFESVFKESGITGVEALQGNMGESTSAKYSLWAEMTEAKRQEIKNTVRVEHTQEIPRKTEEYSGLIDSLQKK